MGINDTSYCALEKDVASYQVVLDSLANPAQIYDLDLEKLLNSGSSDQSRALG